MVYKPQEDSFLLQEQVRKLAFGRVLDMGTGSGIQALTAAEKPEVREVIAVDIDDEAIGLVKAEIKSKHLSKIKVIKSDLFMHIGGSFDTIIFNPPYLPEDETDSDAALNGGKKGFELIRKFLQGAKDYLNNNGSILLIFSNRTGKQAVDSILKKEGYSYELLEQKNLAFFEELYAYQITLKGKSR